MSEGKGSLYVVATPIGNLNDVSPRALEVLRSVALILAEDTRHSRKLLQRYGIEVPTLSFHKFNERDRSEEILNRILTDGIDVAIITDAGTPCISDPGVEIVRRARDSGVPVYGISGPSAIATAVSVSGLPSSEFTFLGFLPRSSGDLEQALHGIRERRISTFVVYESPKRVRALAAAILKEFPQARTCFCCELTKIHERSYYGPINEVVAQLDSDPMAERGEYTVVIHVDYDEPGGKGAIRGTGKQLSPEALLVQVMVDHGCSVREAARIVAKETGLSRNELYQAGLRLRSFMTPVES